MKDDGESGRQPNNCDEQRQYYQQMLLKIDSALGKCAENHSNAARLYSTYEKMLGEISLAAKHQQQTLCHVYLCKREARKENPASPRLKYIDETLKEVKGELQDMRDDYKQAACMSDTASSFLVGIYRQKVRLGKERAKCIEQLEKCGGD